MQAVIDTSGHAIEISLLEGSRELQRLTIFEFEHFVQNLLDLAREASAETTRRAKLAQLPMKHRGDAIWPEHRNHRDFLTDCAKEFLRAAAESDGNSHLNH